MLKPHNENNLYNGINFTISPCCFVKMMIVKLHVLTMFYGLVESGFIRCAELQLRIG